MNDHVGLSHPFGMRLAFMGLSHGGKTVHRTVFRSAFRVPPHIPKRRECRRHSLLFWCERWDSNPHGETTRTSNVLVYHSNTLANSPSIITFSPIFVNIFL